MLLVSVFGCARSSADDGVGVGELLPLVDQRGVDLPDELAEPLDQVGELLGLGLVGDGLPQRLVGVGEVAEHDPFRPGQAVELDVLAERHGPLEHVADDGLGGDHVVTDPGVPAPVDLVGGLKHVLERLGVGDAVEQLHPLLVLDAVGLHRGDGLAAGAEQLGGQDLPGVVERRLDDGKHVERVGVGLLVQQFDGGEGEGGQRLVEREVVLQVDGQPDVPALLIGLVEPLDDAAGEQRPVDLDGPVDVLALLRPVLVVVGEQVLHRLIGVARPVDDVQDHRVRDREADDVSGSGSAATRRSKVGLPQETMPSGGFFLTTRRRASAASPPVLARALA